MGKNEKSIKTTSTIMWYIKYYTTTPSTHFPELKPKRIVDFFFIKIKNMYSSYKLQASVNPFLP